MFFITNYIKSCLCVTFTPMFGYNRSNLQYSTCHGNGGGRGIHVLMWKNEHPLFKKYNECGEIDVLSRGST